MAENWTRPKTGLHTVRFGGILGNFRQGMVHILARRKRSKTPKRTKNVQLGITVPIFGQKSGDFMQGSRQASDGLFANSRIYWLSLEHLLLDIWVISITSKNQSSANWGFKCEGVWFWDPLYWVRHWKYVRKNLIKVNRFYFTLLKAGVNISNNFPKSTNSFAQTKNDRLDHW